MPAQRDEKGRFVRGHSGGPGRPKRDTELTYQAATQEGCPPDVWLRIVKRATEDALGGDASARTFLAKYLLPVPASGAELNLGPDYQGVEFTLEDVKAIQAELAAWERRQRAAGGVDLDRYLYASAAPAPEPTPAPEPAPESGSDPELPPGWDSELYGEPDLEFMREREKAQQATRRQIAKELKLRRQ